MDILCEKCAHKPICASYKVYDAITSCSYFLRKDKKVEPSSSFGSMACGCRIDNYKTKDDSKPDSSMELPRIIAVDFDGTLAENEWPNIGKPKWEVIYYICAEKAKGSKIILWTNRRGKPLIDAINFCHDHGIELDAVNEDIPEVEKYFGKSSRKIFAHVYLDDRAENPKDFIKS